MKSANTLYKEYKKRGGVKTFADFKKRMLKKTSGNTALNRLKINTRKRRVKKKI